MLRALDVQQPHSPLLEPKRIVGELCSRVAKATRWNLGVTVSKEYALVDEELKEMIPAGVFQYYIFRILWWDAKMKALMTIPTADEVQMEIHHSIYVLTLESNAVMESKRSERVVDSLF